MNCRDAEQQILAERDRALSESERSFVAAHVEACPACARLRANLAEAVDSLRAGTHAAGVPDAELEWQRLRREIRGGAGSKSAARRPTWLGWAAIPAAAAALAVAVFVNPDKADLRNASASVARVTVEASVENASTVVFVDDTSGWVFVWSGSDPKHI